MAIDFSNVRLTIQQFQNVSDGKFNAGEVRLTSETGIEKVNNYVRRSWKNKESISHAEVIAIKQAFVKALQQGGVGDEALRRVREQLGLSPDKAVDTKLGERSLKPLTRQQIREILDQNAAAINAAVGEGTIRTSDDLYGGLGAETRRYRKNKREAANAELPTRRTVTDDRRFGLFQALVAGDVDYRSADDRAELLQLAKDALGVVLQLSNGHPRGNVAARLAWGSNGERRFTMEAGTDEATFARRMEDIIVRLSGEDAPDPASFALRDEFRAVPRGERTRWINEMTQGGDRVPYKARVLCIALLQDAGVDDYESLSLPNRLPDALMRALLRDLAALPEDATAEQARQCLAFVRDLADDTAGETAYVPATSTSAFNQAVANAFVEDNNRLFGSFKTLASDVLADARAVFGPEIVREDAEIDVFVRNAGVQGLLAAMGEGVRATPETLRGALLAAAKATAALNLIIARVADRAEALGIQVDVPITAAKRLKLHLPDLIGRLAACNSPADAAAVLDSIQDQVDLEVRRARAVEDCMHRFGDMARAALSSKTGIPVSALGGNVLSSELLFQLTLRLKTKIDLREIPSETPEQIEQAFLAEAERFAAERAPLLKKVDDLPLSDAAKADLKDFLLAQEKVGFIDFNAILTESEKYNMAQLALALREGRPTLDIYQAMQPFENQLDPSVESLLAGKVQEIGAPERTCVLGILFIAALDRHPGIRTDLGAFFARPDVVADDGNRLVRNHVCAPSRLFVAYGVPPAAEAKAELARKIGAGTPPPIFAQALYHAVKAEGIRLPSADPNAPGRRLSPEEAVAVFSAETALGKALAEILEAFPDELTPNALEILARSALRHHGIGDVAQMVGAM